QGVALAALVIEEVGVDRSVEGGIVELEREVVATFFGALRPGGADLGSAHEDTVARSLVVGGAGLGDDADAFGLQVKGDDFALVIVSDLLERTDGSHFTTPICVSSSRPPRPRWRSERPRTIGDAPEGPERSGGRRRSDFLGPREEWAKPRGRKSLRRRCGSDDRGAAVNRHWNGTPYPHPKGALTQV